MPLPVAALVGTAFIGSIMGIFARELAAQLNVAEQVGLRCLMGALVLLAVSWRSIDFGKYARMPPSDLRLTAVRAVSMFVIAISLGTVAFVNGNYASVAVIMALPAPALLSALVFKERISYRETALVSFAFVGAAITIISAAGLRFEFNWPLSCAVLATLFMSYGILARKRQSSFLNNRETTLLMLFTAALIMGVFSAAWILWSGDVPRITPHTLLVALIAGICNIGFLVLSNYAIPKVKGVVVNNILALQPLFGAVIGFALFNETLSPLAIVGGVMILTAVILIANPALLPLRPTAQLTPRAINAPPPK
nr:DMT family transporter [Gluconacetobacter asukensis]